MYVYFVYQVSGYDRDLTNFYNPKTTNSILSIGANEAGQTAFTSMFMLIWVGSTVVTVNSKLLGGALSFFQCVCILGYCVFPLVISAIVGIVLKQKLLRLPIVGAACFWCVYGEFEDIVASLFDEIDENWD